MNEEENYKNLLKKVEELTRQKKLDLSSDEDLSIAIMNLISIEEHLFFTGAKTGKEKYFNLLEEIREMRKELLKRIIKDYEGEVWCISKHLLAASMRLIEVGTKELNKGDKERAKNLFKNAYKLYSLFWGLNLEIVRLGEVEKIADDKILISNDRKDKKKPKELTILGRLEEIVKKIVDCCKE